MLVRATKKGYYEHCIRDVGDVFDVQPVDITYEVTDLTGKLVVGKDGEIEKNTINVVNPCSKWTEVVKNADVSGIVPTVPKAQTRFSKREEVVI